MVAVALKSYTAWADGVAEESTKSEYQNALIRIEDPTLVTVSYDVETDTTTVTGDPVVYAGPARLIPVRWASYAANQNQANPTNLSDIRIQIPRYVDVAPGFGSGEFGLTPFGSSTDAFERIRTGCRVFVDSCPRNRSLETYLFMITADIQGSMTGARTFQASVDSDAVVS